MSSSFPPLWRKKQRENFNRVQDLLDFLMFSSVSRAKVLQDPKFPCNVPRRFAEKMEKNNPDDPLFLQFGPKVEETEIVPGFVVDPVQDKTFCKTGKMLQKYKGRALLLVTSACAVHCRFCFRQNFPYETEVLHFDQEIQTISQDPSIQEVILSGGDPLSLSDAMLKKLLLSLEEIPHVKRIRFHTRFVLGIPERIDDSFLALLASLSKQVFFVIHCNHVKELDADVLSALRKILALKIPVLNQSVLLKGVNDKEEVLLQLYETMIDHGILPYYLHQLDRVEGTAHFLVSDERAFELILFLQKHLPGFGVPKLVREEAGSFSKTPLCPPGKRP